MATKKTNASKKSGKTQVAGAPKSMPKEGKDPKGGLTAKGREYFAEKEGAHLRPGVQGPADTPEKMVRKGSFLRRHFAHPRGPVKDEKGKPTRLALSAHAWGEPVPQTMADTKKLATKGHELLEEYHRVKDKQGAKGRPAETPEKSGRTAAKKVAAKKVAAKKVAAKKVAATKTTAKKQAAKRDRPLKSMAAKTASKADASKVEPKRAEA